MGNKQSKLNPDHLQELLKKTRFQQKEITQWYKGFMKDCPKGFITKEDYIAIYKNYFPFGDVVKYASLIFKYLDKNGDQEIDFDEFISGLDISCRGTTSEKLEYEDGFISKAEMLYIVDAIIRMVGTKEIKESPTERVEKIFKEMDLDGDGLLSFEEFQEGAQRDPLVLNSLSLYSSLV